MKLILWIILTLGFLFISIRYIERKSLYYPMKEIITEPDEIGMRFEDVYFKASDNVRLHGWFIPNHKAGYTIIFAHGNAGNISHRLEKLSILYEMGLAIFIIDYRGYGKSQGTPSEQGFYRDIRGAYDYLVKEKKKEGRDILLYGESLGGVCAIDLAGNVDVGAVITEDTFTSIEDMARIAYPFIPPFVFSSRFDAIHKIKKVNCPKLIIHSTDDEIVPFRLGDKLFQAAGQPKQFLKIRGTHNNAFLSSEDEYKEGIVNFIEGLQK